MLMRADVKCYLCGHISGQIEGLPGDKVNVQSFRPVSGDEGPRLTRKGSICCSRCGGGVFLDEWETARWKCSVSRPRGAAGHASIHCPRRVDPARRGPVRGSAAGSAPNIRGSQDA